MVERVKEEFGRLLVRATCSRKQNVKTLDAKMEASSLFYAGRYKPPNNPILEANKHGSFYKAYQPPN